MPLVCRALRRRQYIEGISFVQDSIWGLELKSMMSTEIRSVEAIKHLQSRPGGSRRDVPGFLVVETHRNINCPVTKTVVCNFEGKQIPRVVLGTRKSPDASGGDELRRVLFYREGGLGKRSGKICRLGWNKIVRPVGRPIEVLHVKTKDSIGLNPRHATGQC